MKSFKLVNPLILGQFNTEYKADNGLDAIGQFWNDLSTHVTNNMPALYVTLKDEQNQISHYKISEKLKGGSKVTDYTISELENKLNQTETESFIKSVEKYESKKTAQIQRQIGGVKNSGRRRDKDSSSSDSDSDLSDSNDYYNFSKYRRLTQPISMWYYTPSIYRVNSVFIPTFNTPVVPYVKIWIPAWV